MSIKDVLFDLDGVITDTARYHFLAWKELCDKNGFHFTEKDNERLKGVSRRRSLEIILEINGVSGMYDEATLSAMETEKNDLYVQLIRQMTPDDVLPGVSSFLAECRAAGLRLAVASASRNAFTVLEGLQLLSAFDYVADAGRISRTKPDPEVFLDCAAALDLPPEKCIGVEDAQAGIEAIKAAGMFAVGIHVDVTTIAPDLPLASTEELSLTRISDAYGKRAQLL